jgi:hypothetical protein
LYFFADRVPERDMVSNAKSTIIIIRARNDPAIIPVILRSFFMVEMV